MIALVVKVNVSNNRILKEEPHMKHIVIDLEMSKKHKKGSKMNVLETIEIGAVMLDDDLQEVSSFKTYVKPEYSDGVAANITKLTGITNEMVEHAPVFNEALRMFTNWCIDSGEAVTIYAWSDSDYAQIAKEMDIKEYRISAKEERVFRADAWADIQKEFDSDLGFARQVSLKMALDMAGVDFTGREHDALDDARNTAELLRILRDEEQYNATLRKIKEVMSPTKTSSKLGDLIDFSLFACA